MLDKALQYCRTLARTKEEEKELMEFIADNWEDIHDHEAEYLAEGIYSSFLNYK